MKRPQRLFRKDPPLPAPSGPQPWPARRRTLFFAPAGRSLHDYRVAKGFPDGSFESEVCLEADRRLHKLQYLWDGIHEQAEVMAPSQLDEVNLMDAFVAIADSITGGADLLFEIEIEIEAAFYNAWRIRQAVRKLPGVGAIDMPKVEFVRNQILEHPNYATVFARSGVSLGSGHSPALSTEARTEKDRERFRGFMFDECMTEFVEAAASAFKSATDGASAGESARLDP